MVKVSAFLNISFCAELMYWYNTPMLSTSNVASEKTHTYPVSNNFKKCTEDVVIIAITRLRWIWNSIYYHLLFILKHFCTIDMLSFGRSTHNVVLNALLIVVKGDNTITRNLQNFNVYGQEIENGQEACLESQFILFRDYKVVMVTRHSRIPILYSEWNEINFIAILSRLVNLVYFLFSRSAVFIKDMSWILYSMPETNLNCCTKLCNILNFIENPNPLLQRKIFIDLQKNLLLWFNYLRLLNLAR